MSDFDEHKRELRVRGFTIIPNVINKPTIDIAKGLFYLWYDAVDGLKEFYKKCVNSGNLSTHEVGHQEFAWFLRTRPNVMEVFAQLWDTHTDNLTTSFDGCCYYKPGTKISNHLGIHTDQAPIVDEISCYQGFISMTNNKKNSFTVYDGSHKLHNKYFLDRGLAASTNTWEQIDPNYLETIESDKITLYVPAGSMVIWDSRIFSQTNISSTKEERLIQYICMMPKNNENNENNDQTIMNKRRKYLDTRRTTTHNVYQIQVSGKHPCNYGHEGYRIDYDSLAPPDLVDYKKYIEKLI